MKQTRYNANLVSLSKTLYPKSHDSLGMNPQQVRCLVLLKTLQRRLT
jgi:hypothetical protein